MSTVAASSANADSLPVWSSAPPPNPTKGDNMADTLTHDDCLDGPTDCEGPVEYRMALSGTGKPFPRCDKHWDERLDKQDEINQRYPDSPVAPADFDPAYAGEHWDEDY
jgi:hypothetical protein